MGTNFSITRQSGFALTFANGYTVSVQFGPGMYCDNKLASFDAPTKTNDWNSRFAEVGIIDPEGGFITLAENDDVLGWQSPDEVANLIAWVTQLSVD